MKKYYVRLTSSQSQWFDDKASKMQMTKTDFVRFTINELITNGNLEAITSHYAFGVNVIEEVERKETGYLILTYKLVDKLLELGAEGTEKRNTAYQETLEI